MNKIIGMFFIITGIVALVSSAYIDSNYGTGTITGNSIRDILNRPSLELNAFDYLGAVAISYSIIGLTAGFIFLFRFGK